MIVCRTEEPITNDIKRKIALFCNVKPEAVIEARDASTIYEVPLIMMNEKLDEIVLKKLNIENNKEHYDNLLTMHHHLQQAKNTLVNALESHTGHYQHHIDGKETKPEGFVVHHEHEGKSEPTKLVNRAEFAKQNLLKVRK